MPDTTLRVFRGDAAGGEFVDYTVPVDEGQVVLDVVHTIQALRANDLAVRWNCKAGKCGSCSAEAASDKVIVPVQCEYLSMRGLVQLQNTLEMIQENLNPGVEIEGILPTMLDSRTVHAKEAVEILEENFGDLVFKSRIKKAVKFAEAPVRGAAC